MTSSSPPWVPCRKPCRFLLERILESGVSGIPVGVEEKCANPAFLTWKHMTQEVDELLKAVYALNETVDFVVGTYDREFFNQQKALLETISSSALKLQAYLAGYPEWHPEKSEDRFFTQTEDEAKHKQLLRQLGAMSSAAESSGLVDWLLATEEEFNED